MVFIQGVNIPIALIAIGVVYSQIRQPKPVTADRRIDYGGIATVSLGLVAFMVALDQSVDLDCVDPRIIGAVVLSVVLLVAFGMIERRAGEHALIPRDVMARPDFRACCLALLLVSTTFFRLPVVRSGSPSPPRFLPVSPV